MSVYKQLSTANLPQLWLENAAAILGSSSLCRITVIFVLFYVPFQLEFMAIIARSRTLPMASPGNPTRVLLEPLRCKDIGETGGNCNIFHIHAHYVEHAFY